MNPSMHMRVRNLFVNAGLTTGYTTQMLLWQDTGKGDERFIVFRPNGGSNIDRDVGGQYYILVDLITGTGNGEAAKSETDVQAIIDYIQKNPTTDTCVGQITNMGGIPSPVLSNENRLVWRLQFACLFG